METQEPQVEMLEPQTGEGQSPVEAETQEAEETALLHGQDAAAEPKSGLQKRIDELTAARYEAERQRDRAWEVLYEKEKALSSQPTEAPAVQPVTAKPRIQDFDDDENYQEALVEWKAEQVWQKREAQRQAEEDRKAQTAEQKKHDDWIRQARSKYPDFDAVVRRPMAEVPITTPMADAIKEEELGHEVAYYLGKHPQEAHRIANLSIVSQVREIGKLAAKLETTKTKPKTQTGAPAPTQPVSGKGAVGKRIEEMTAAEYIAYQNEREFGASRR